MVSRQMEVAGLLKQRLVMTFMYLFDKHGNRTCKFCLPEKADDAPKQIENE